MKRGFRAFCTFVASVSLAVIPALSQPLATSAATTGTLFAITGPNQSVLSRLDPVTGAITPVEDLAGADQGQLVTITGDPPTHRIFVLRSTVTFDENGISVKNELITVDSQTGAFSVSPPMSQNIGQLAFDSSAKVLYGLGNNAVFAVDPATGAATLVANLGDLGPGILSMGLVPGAHTIYVNNEILGSPGDASDQVLTVNTQTGAVSTSPKLTQLVRIVFLDPSAGLFGATECCPRQLVRIDPGTGAETSIGSFNNSNDQALQFAMAADSASHTIFMDLMIFAADFTTQSQVISMNEVTGATTVSPVINDLVSSLYFEPVVSITPESIKADVRAALASGAITTAGVASSLLAKLDEASAARARDQCGTAARVYQAFVSELNAQRGKAVAPATASQLNDEAQYLIANCP